MHLCREGNLLIWTRWPGFVSPRGRHFSALCFGCPGSTHNSWTKISIKWAASSYQWRHYIYNSLIMNQYRLRIKQKRVEKQITQNLFNMYCAFINMCHICADVFTLRLEMITVNFVNPTNNLFYCILYTTTYYSSPEKQKPRLFTSQMSVVFFFFFFLLLLSAFRLPAQTFAFPVYTRSLRMCWWSRSHCSTATPFGHFCFQLFLF